jgi:tripeptidyl-peptidase-1
LAGPYVTTVGGTTKIPEVAISFSGGGFSNYFAQPTWQTTAVKKYITSFGTTSSTLYKYVSWSIGFDTYWQSCFSSATGRAYPDLSAQSNYFQVVIGGSTSPVGGTSASAPAVAAIFSLLNDYRISLGKPTLGFLNPLLYSNLTTAFNDITSGQNPGCSTNGFKALAGWDPVTGFGTPDFLKLQAIVKNIWSWVG